MITKEAVLAKIPAIELEYNEILEDIKKMTDPISQVSNRLDDLLVEIDEKIEEIDVISDDFVIWQGYHTVLLHLRESISELADSVDRLDEVESEFAIFVMGE